MSCLVYHNNGDGTFKDVSKTCAIASSPGKAPGVAVNDFDRDGWPDILVANDSFPQQLFRNNRDGTFSDVALESGLGLGRNKFPLANDALPLLDRHDLTGRHPWIIFILAVSPTHGQVGGVRLP